VLPIDKRTIKPKFEDKVVELLLELCAGVGCLVLAREDVGMVHAALVPSERGHCEGDGKRTERSQGGRRGLKGEGEPIFGLACLYTE